MRTTISALIILSVGVLMCACHPKDRPVLRLEEFTEELVLNSDQYSSSQWRAAIKTYAKIEVDIARYSDKYDYDERRKIARLEKLCEDQLYKGAGYSVGNRIREVGVHVEQFLDGLNESLEDVIK